MRTITEIQADALAWEMVIWATDLVGYTEISDYTSGAQVAYGTQLEGHDSAPEDANIEYVLTLVERYDEALTYLGTLPEFRNALISYILHLKNTGNKEGRK